jgi:hypothetical protein
MSDWTWRASALSVAASIKKKECSSRPIKVPTVSRCYAGRGQHFCTPLTGAGSPAGRGFGSGGDLPYRWRRRRPCSLPGWAGK